jgi:hypothetical protein
MVVERDGWKKLAVVLLVENNEGNKGTERSGGGSLEKRRKGWPATAFRFDMGAS